MYLLLQHYLMNEIDNTLMVYSARVHGTLNPKEMPETLDYDVVHSQLPPISELASPGIFIQFIDKYGNVVLKSGNLDNQELPIKQTLIAQGFEGNVAINTVPEDDGSEVRIMVSPMYLGGQTLLLTVAQSLDTFDSVMSNVRFAILIGISLALLLSGISGAFLVRRALSPVKRITNTARNIEESSDLSQRVYYSGPPDEMGQLAMTFNHMIEHLNKVFQSQKQFVADASHDLRIPLTVMKGNLDLLRRNPDREELGEVLSAIDTEINRMTQIASSLLTLAEVESGQVGTKEDIPLEIIILDEYQRARRLGGNRKILLQCHEELKVKGDNYRIRQLLSNLIDNAIKYTPDEGTITLSLSRDNGWACLEVSDTGIGISPEHLPNIFNPFYRTDKARSRDGGGVGLGLAIVKGIAEQHGGKVTVTSELGKGSTFTARLKL